MRILYLLQFILSTALTTPRKPSFITNKDIPICKNCIHFIEHKTNYPYDDPPTDELGRCSIFGIKSVVTGNIKYKLAELCRLNKDECGKNGNYFLQKVFEEEVE